jgi:hypothetical protein
VWKICGFASLRKERDIFSMAAFLLSRGFKAMAAGKQDLVPAIFQR